MDEITIKKYLEDVKAANDFLAPFYKKTVLAKHLGIKYDTLVRKMDNYSLSSDEMLKILDFYADKIELEKMELMKDLFTDRYKSIEILTTNKLKSLPFSLSDISKYTSIGYNKIINVVNGRENWGFVYLAKISTFFDYLATVRNL